LQLQHDDDAVPRGGSETEGVAVVKGRAVSLPMPSDLSLRGTGLGPGAKLARTIVVVVVVAAALVVGVVVVFEGS